MSDVFRWVMIVWMLATLWAQHEIVNPPPAITWLLRATFVVGPLAVVASVLVELYHGRRR